MAYAALNKSGCEERKGNVKVRLDFYLDATDPRYDERYLYLVDVTSAEYLAGYPGKVDEFGNPIDQEDYDNWIESLPHIWENTPFHSHFVYFDADVTIDDIKAEMEFHLPNFYKAFQERKDEVKGGMRHGWATEKRIKPTDYSKTDTSAEYDARVAECQAAVDALTEFTHEPEAKEGQEFPATAIDIGPGATDRSDDFAPNYTIIDKANSANDTGTIDTFEVWAGITMDGTNKVGTFHGSGTDYTNRDGETIGTVTSGAKRTFTGLDIDVSTGDFAGVYGSAGEVETDTSGGADAYYKSGDQFGAGQQTYALGSGYAISLYGTGETAAPITLELRASSSTRADVTLNVGVSLAIRSATSTRAAIILDTLVAIHIRSPTDTDARIALDTIVTLAAKSATDTRAALTLNTLIALELSSSTATRADIILSVGATTLTLKSSTDTRASISLAVILQLTRQVAASTDDCFRRLEIPWFSLTATFAYIGSQVADYDKSGMGLRFLNITIPKGRTILEAELRCRAAANDTSTTVKGRISAEDVDNPATFADDAAAFDTRYAGRTTARVDWDSIPSWTLASWYDSPDIKTVIQEIVNRGGWASGHDIVIFFEDFDNRSSSGAHRAVWHYDEAADEAPKLYIKWTSAAPITLELRSSTSTRADAILDTSVAIAFKSTTATRAAVVLNTGISISLRSSTDTDARLALSTIIALALKSSTNTRADLTLSALVALELRSSTETRAALEIQVTAITYLECRSSTDTRASLALDTLITLALNSQTDTRASLTLTLGTLLALRSITATRAALALSALISLELRSSTSTRAAIALTVAFITELELRSATATRAAIQLNTLIVLGLLSQTTTRADLFFEIAVRHQEITMAMQDRSLSMSMASRTFGMKVRQNG